MTIYQFFSYQSQQGQIFWYGDPWLFILLWFKIAETYDGNNLSSSTKPWSKNHTYDSTIPVSHIAIIPRNENTPDSR